MRGIILLIILTFTLSAVQAQHNADSLAYQLQRKKINTMLAQRAQKFGQYDSSLSKHTGIFGFQTKKDIRRSNDILMDIVKTDNEIYKELKILLEYRTFQQKQVISYTRETQSNVLGYMTTINKLRTQIDLLKADAAAQEQQEGKTRSTLIITIIGLSAIILLLLFIRRKKRTPVKRKPAARKSSRKA
ncbi:hypothetical protein KXD93_04205 [Mucilaginibacter sp. BJC16-A38]|uniref:hypothetical protein n=1 Tax=Mucilaginibacter phenanthrenivorans TaxID=1234842 RepID=UPI0021575CAF|nr:hypothetical protein [Mucilaginibacter phenanthrenivorans]MCR8556826.1 hypothetical protein [Mucilaginibacter phenanthrenivorans]